MREVVTVIRLGLVAAAIAALGAAASLYGQGAGAPAPRTDISGYWELRFDSFNAPRAQLTTRAQAAVEARRKKDVEAIQQCINIGMPALMDDRSPVDIRQSATVVGMVAKSQSSTRYIYIDGRKHPDAEELEATTNGHSIGRWEGEVLVVDTIGFNERGMTAIPGGGYRTARSHLAERYALSHNGEQLTVTFTWTDPTVFQKLHSYAFTYYKIRQISEPRVLNCLPNDPDRARFLTELPQPVRF